MKLIAALLILAGGAIGQAKVAPKSKIALFYPNGSTEVFVLDSHSDKIADWKYSVNGGCVWLAPAPDDSIVFCGTFKITSVK